MKRMRSEQTRGMLQGMKSSVHTYGMADSLPFGYHIHVVASFQVIFESAKLLRTNMNCANYPHSSLKFDSPKIFCVL
jgi:hypothetical protein